jgi:hypothetical protein
VLDLRHDTYNVSSGRPATNREFADSLQAITPGLRLVPGRQDGPGDDPYLDTTRAADRRHRLSSASTTPPHRPRSGRLRVL